MNMSDQLRLEGLRGELRHDEPMARYLMSDFVGRFEVGVQGCFFDICATGRTGGVDVDRYKRLSWINYN